MHDAAIIADTSHSSADAHSASKTTAVFMPAYILIAALFAAALADSTLNGGALRAAMQITSGLVLALVQFVIPVLIAMLLVRSYRAAGREQMVSHAAEQLKRTLLSWHLIHRILPVVAFTVFLASFVHFKMRIPDIGGFRWDETFAAMDQALFGGVSAWEFLAPVYEMPWLISALDKLYSLWIPGIFVFWCWVAYGSRLPMALRQQYLVTTIVTWVFGGVVLGTVFGSVGPCFYAQIHPALPDLFAGLTAKIAAIHASHPLFAIPVQAQLFAAFQNPDVNVVGGISAMPSMHNAQATIFVLTALRVNKWLAAAMVLFGAVIVSASVILGWHYAVDSLAGMALALAIWKLSGTLLPKLTDSRNS
jgi:membrane-associated phospholipid phosphatase